MRVLLTNASMRYLGGTQRWVGTMAAELQRRGMDVSLLTDKNDLYPEISDHKPGSQYDLALVNHNGPFRETSGISISRSIYTIHGFVPAEEWAPFGADGYAAVSELAAAHVPWTATVIRNPIDIDLFHPESDVSESPRRVLFLSNRQGAARPLLEQACVQAGLELRVAGKDAPVHDPWRAMNWADIVVTIGRGVPEALACNRNVYALDHYGAKGYVTMRSMERMRMDSYAGHLDARWPSPGELAKELMEGYDPSLRMRERIMAEHSPSAVVDRYLALASDIKPIRLVVGEKVRRYGGPLLSPRVTKAVSYVKLGRPAAALQALRGSQNTPPLLRWKLPAGVELTYQAG